VCRLAHAGDSDWYQAVQQAETKRLAGNYDAAVEILSEALQKTEGAPEDDARLGIIFHNLGSIHQELGNYLDAERCYERSIGVWEKLKGTHAVTKLVQTLNHLVATLLEAGKYDKAEKLSKRVLAIRPRATGLSDIDAASLLTNSAAVYHAQGKPEEALPLYEEALAMVQKTKGPEHPDAALTMNNLGLLKFTIGDNDEAKTYFQRALTAWEHSLGPNHPYVARALVNLVALECKTGHASEAEPMARRALSVAEGTLGREHYMVGVVCAQYAELMRQMNRKSEAKKMQKRSDDIMRANSLRNLDGHTVSLHELAGQVH
jgi:tetratricopeptide (TPR) repeat protein